MYIDKEIDALVLYRYPLIDSMSVSNNNTIILESRDRLFELGYLRLDDYTKTMRYSDTGNEIMLATYHNNKELMIDFLKRHDGKFTEELFRDELDGQGSDNCDFWIDFFLAKLKKDGIITQFKASDSNRYVCYFD